MLELSLVRRPLAIGLVALFGLFAGLTSNPAEARPRYHGYSSQSFKQFQQHRYHEYYSNYQRYGYGYAMQADAQRYGHLYAERGSHYRRHVTMSRREARAEREMSRASRRAERMAMQHHSRRATEPRVSQAPLLPQDGVSVQTSAPTVQTAAPVMQGGSSNVVAEARRYIGGNPTGRRSLWCARFMNMVLARSGHRTTGSDMASSFANYGRRVSGPQVGAIAVMSRGRRGGHVGIVSGIDAKGNPIVVSGNHSRRVAEATYSRSRVYAYVMPN